MATVPAQSAMSLDSDKLRINIDGTASHSRRAERAVMTVQISSDTSSKEEALENVKQAAHALQAVAKSLRVEPEGSEATATGGQLRAPLTDWNMGRLTTNTFILFEMQQLLQSSATKVEPQELEKYRKYSARTELTMKFQDFSVLSTVASKVAVTSHAVLTGISWHLLDATRHELEREVRKLAVKDAMAKANDFAEAAMGTRTAKMTFVESTGTNLFGGGGWTNNSFQQQMTMQSQQASVFGQQSRGFGTATGAQQAEQEELNLEPGKIVVSWSVSAEFVA